MAIFGSNLSDRHILVMYLDWYLNNQYCITILSGGYTCLSVYAVGLRGVHLLVRNSYYKYARSLTKTTVELLFGRLFDLLWYLRWHKMLELCTVSMIPILHNPIRSLSSSRKCITSLGSCDPETLFI